MTPEKTSTRIVVPILTALIGAIATLVATYMTIISDKESQLEAKRMEIELRENQNDELKQSLQDMSDKLNTSLREIQRGEQRQELTVYKVIDANGWTDTGISLSQGQRVEISCTGTWSIWGERPDIWPLVGPNGYTWQEQIIEKYGWDRNQIERGLPLPSAPIGSLVGRVGNSTVFLVGPNSVFKATTSGKLFLGCNDFDQNNLGSMVANIIIR